MKKKKHRIQVDTGPLSQNPFSQLGSLKAPAGEDMPAPQHKTSLRAETHTRQSSLTIREEKRAKGKWVTCIYHLEENPEKHLKKLKRTLGTGGSITDGGILEIQGHQCEKVRVYMIKQGFKVR
jgi:translation initiation factor 1 (eIF-1/SUI1)